MKRSKLGFWIFVGPIFLAFLIVVIIPMLRGFYFSFTDWNGISNEVTFIGLSNYGKAFRDPEFFAAFKLTATFAILSVFTINIMGFLLALLVTQGLRGANFQRSVFFMPNLIGGLILGFVWQFIFVKAFDNIGSTFNLPFLEGWLSTTTTGFWGLVILMSWQMSGYMMIIYIAAIQSIPESLIEAAKIDGANGLQRLKFITVPMVMPAFTVGLFLSLSNSFKLFDQNLALTGGAPYGSTEMMALNIYQTAFSRNQLGYAQAKAVIFLLAVAAITLTQIYLTKSKEVEL
ncbi:carbohydrate ABC transporter permease [Fusibacter sp. 3D3]|uniref:carbohydrate ABC transporter permease n=1 Tax=Fusibacter sp. 3D3 TaxID=1048380 RepID=UPI000853BC10|nr:sugar ABC transporter permease [Fusibacter sp. 3D3]GAU76791.1 multiple sugar ABC transporter membrane-spanning permease protein MsmF [Fusibacter sp. 3D3]